MSKKQKRKQASTTVRRELDVMPIHYEGGPLNFELRTVEVRLLTGKELGEALRMEQGANGHRLRILSDRPLDEPVIASSTQGDEESAG